MDKPQPYHPVPACLDYHRARDYILHHHPDLKKEADKFWRDYLCESGIHDGCYFQIDTIDILAWAKGEVAWNDEVKPYVEYVERLQEYFGDNINVWIEW